LFGYHLYVDGFGFMVFVQFIQIAQVFPLPVFAHLPNLPEIG